MDFTTLEKGLRELLEPERPDGACGPTLYRFASGEASAQEAAAFEAHLAGCPACRVDLAALQAEDRQVAAQPVRFFGFRWSWLVAGAAVAAMLLITLWLVGIPKLSQKEHGDGFLIKGPYQLQLAVQRGDRRFVGASGSRFETGDVLGLFYTAPEERWLVVFFSDAGGNISQVFPGGAPVKVPAGVERPLPDGAVLEPGEGCEWLVALFSTEPLDTEQARRALRRAVRDRDGSCTLAPLGLDDAAVSVLVLRRS
jgi:hypothetical protein